MLPAMARCRGKGDDAIVDAERWSMPDKTIPAVRAMLKRLDSRLAAIQVRWPEAESLLLVRLPPSQLFPRGDYTVARDQDWIVAGGHGDNVWVQGLSETEFNEAFELLPG